MPHDDEKLTVFILRAHEQHLLEMPEEGGSEGHY